MTTHAPNPDQRESAANPASPLYTHAILDELQSLERAVRYHDWLFELARPHLGERVLEVGAGIGTMTNHVLDRQKVFVLEYDPAFGSGLRTRYADRANVTVLVGDILDRNFLRSSLPDGVDSVMSFNVFEHIEDDLQALRNSADQLRRGGRVVLYVPAFPALYGPADAAIGHHRRYRRRGLLELATRTGLHPITCHYVNLPGFFAWFLNARILRSSRAIGSNEALQAYDRFIVPATRAIERRFKPPFGQSLLLVAERR